MEERSTATLEKIQRAALAEFLDKCFLGASLRQIVKNAGVTTGAFYGYFSSKEALFASIVEPHAAALMGRFMEAQTTFAALPEAEQPAHMGGWSPPTASTGWWTTSAATPSREQILFWFERFRQGDVNSPAYQRQIIDNFVNSVYVFEDRVVLNFNFKENAKTVPLREVLGSSADGNGPPK